MTNKLLINWEQIYNEQGIFHVYLTERKRGKTDTKAWSFLEAITTQKDSCFAWIRRRWHDSLNCSKPYFDNLIYKFCEEKGIARNNFEIQEKGVIYLGQQRIYFYDLFSYQRARGGIARITFQEIVYEEAIPLDQEFLFVNGRTEQWMFRDLIDSLKRNLKGSNAGLKITFLANPYFFSAWFLDNFGNIFELRKQAETLAKENNNQGVKSWSKDKQWFLYLNLLPGKTDPHSSALEERTNPSLRNWDEFMLDKEKIGKYQILHSIQDFYFCELGVRKVNKKYALMYFTKNTKETDSSLVNYCWDLEEVAKSKLKNCVIREKPLLISKWIKMLKNDMLSFVDYRSRDWFLEQIKGLHEPKK